MLHDLAQLAPYWLLIVLAVVSVFGVSFCVGVLLGRALRSLDRVAIAESPPECWNRRCPVCDCQALNWAWLVWHIDQEHLEEALLAEDVGIAMLREAA